MNVPLRALLSRLARKNDSAAPADPPRERQVTARVIVTRLPAQHVPVGTHAFRTLRST